MSKSIQKNALLMYENHYSTLANWLFDTGVRYVHIEWESCIYPNDKDNTTIERTNKSKTENALKTSKQIHENTRSFLVCLITRGLVPIITSKKCEKDNNTPCADGYTFIGKQWVMMTLSHLLNKELVERISYTCIKDYETINLNHIENVFIVSKIKDGEILNSLGYTAYVVNEPEYGIIL